MSVSRPGYFTDTKYVMVLKDERLNFNLTVTSAPAAPFDGTVLRPDGTIAVYTATSVLPLRLRLPVTAGLTYQIDVVHISPATREFELNTTLQ